MYKTRLLERILMLEENPQKRDEGNSEVINSIVLHLKKLLNTRQGSAQIADDYGIPDITNLPVKDVEERGRKLKEIITEVIKKYEKRLTKVKLTVEASELDKLEIKFKLEALLAQKVEVPVIFETIVSSSGQIQLKQ